MATVKNIGSDELRLIRVPSKGLLRTGVNTILAAGASGTVPDDFTTTDGFKALVTASKVEITAFGVDDVLVAAETAQITSIYLVTMDNTPADFPNADNVAAVDTGGAETYDFSNPADRALSITINGVAITHNFIPSDFASLGAGTAAEVATSLTGNSAFAAQATAADAAGSIEITSKALGTSSTIISAAGGAATLLGLSTTTVPGTGAPSTVQLLVKKPDGTAAPGVSVTIESFDAATAGSSGPATTVMQIASKGTFSSGEFANPAVGVTDANGELDFEVVQAYGGLDTAFIDLSTPAAFFLADTDRKGSDSSREEIVRAS
jgi:hypothetical protein